MKYVILLLLLSGCAAMPYSIENVSVRDKVEIQRGVLEGCSMNVANVDTLVTNSQGKISEAEVVCGKIQCEGEAAYNEAFNDKFKCLDFEAVRLDRPSHTEQNLERGRLNR